MQKNFCARNTISIAIIIKPTSFYPIRSVRWRHAETFRSDPKAGRNSFQNPTRVMQDILRPLFQIFG